MARGDVRQALEQLFAQQGEVSTRDVAEAAGVSRQAAQKQLKALVAAGRLTVRGKARAARYLERGGERSFDAALPGMRSASTRAIRTLTAGSPQMSIGALLQARAPARPAVERRRRLRLLTIDDSARPPPYAFVDEVPVDDAPAGLGGPFAFSDESPDAQVIALPVGDGVPAGWAVLGEPLLAVGEPTVARGPVAPEARLSGPVITFPRPNRVLEALVDDSGSASWQPLDTLQDSSPNNSSDTSFSAQGLEFVQLAASPTVVEQIQTFESLNKTSDTSFEAQVTETPWAIYEDRVAAFRAQPVDDSAHKASDTTVFEARLAVWRQLEATGDAFTARIEAWKANALPTESVSIPLAGWSALLDQPTPRPAAWAVALDGTLDAFLAPPPPATAPEPVEPAPTEATVFDDRIAAFHAREALVDDSTADLVAAARATDFDVTPAPVAAVADPTPKWIALAGQLITQVLGAAPLAPTRSVTLADEVLLGLAEASTDFFDAAAERTLARVTSESSTNPAFVDEVLRGLAQLPIDQPPVDDFPPGVVPNLLVVDSPKRLPAIDYFDDLFGPAWRHEPRIEDVADLLAPFIVDHAPLDADFLVPPAAPLDWEELAELHEMAMSLAVTPAPLEPTPPVTGRGACVDDVPTGLLLSDARLPTPPERRQLAVASTGAEYRLSAHLLLANLPADVDVELDFTGTAPSDEFLDELLVRWRRANPGVRLHARHATAAVAAAFAAPIPLDA